MKQKLKILICDADSRVLKRLKSWVLAMGEDVYSSEDAIVAKGIFEEIDPDILLVSHDLKNMGAIEFISSIKKDKPSQAIILMLSGDGDNNIFKRSIDLQVDKYLNMPVDASMLFSAIEGLSREKIWHEEFRSQKRLLQDYKDAIDLSFSVSKHDKEGNIFYVNDLFCTTTKLRYVDAMKGMINPLQNPHEDMNIVWDALNVDSIYRDRQIFKFEDEQDHIIDITAVAMLDDNKEAYEYLVFSNDVSEVIHASRKIKEQKVDNKLQRLEHLKELNKVKDSFLTVFSHELRTPLNAIINFSEYIKKHLQKEDFKKRDRLLEQVVQINSSGWNMLGMIENLLDSMKLRDGEVKLLSSEFMLSTLISDSLSSMSNELEDIKVIKLFKDEFTIINDEKRMKQIFNNLLSNAIKYCKSKIAIIIKSDADEFILEVLDDGEGFLNTKGVFTLFSQSNEDSMTRTASGTGVGLFVVKELCDLMEYKIMIERSKNLGGARVMIKGKKDFRG